VLERVEPEAPEHVSVVGTEARDASCAEDDLPCVQTGCKDARVPGAFYCAAHGGVTPAEAELPGDDGFLESLDQALAGGSITARERRERRLTHFAIRRAAVSFDADSREAAILADAQALVDAGEARWIDTDPAPAAPDRDQPTLCHICRAPAPDGCCTDFAACNYRARRRLGIPAHVCNELFAREQRQAP
jgi:hypothetical protein